jgi:hypothetical protein
MSATVWPTVPAPDDRRCVCEAVDGMRIGRGSRNTRRNPAPVPHCPLQIPHNLTGARTRTAAVRSLRLTAWAMARSIRPVIIHPQVSNSGPLEHEAIDLIIESLHSVSRGLQVVLSTKRVHEYAASKPVFPILNRLYNPQSSSTNSIAPSSSKIDLFSRTNNGMFYLHPMFNAVFTKGHRTLPSAHCIQNTPSNPILLNSIYLLVSKIFFPWRLHCIFFICPVQIVHILNNYCRGFRL